MTSTSSRRDMTVTVDNVTCRSTLGSGASTFRSVETFTNIVRLDLDNYDETVV